MVRWNHVSGQKLGSAACLPTCHPERVLRAMQQGESPSAKDPVVARTGCFAVQDSPPRQARRTAQHDSRRARRCRAQVSEQQRARVREPCVRQWLSQPGALCSASRTRRATFSSGPCGRNVMSSAFCERNVRASLTPRRACPERSRRDVTPSWGALLRLNCTAGRNLFLRGGV